MNRTVQFILLCFCASLLPAPCEDIQEVFERARALQAGNQNLAEAIRLYAQVVTQAKSHREIAAQSQYQEGVLYERLGRRSDARQAFLAVIRDFPDQTAVVRLARVRLPANTLPPVTANHAVWKGDDVEEVSCPSPDGRFLAFIDWRSDALKLRDLASGETRIVTKTGGPWCVFSHDGKRIAYTRYYPSPGVTNDLRIVGTDGANEHVIYQDGDRQAPHATDWSPDGKFLLVFNGRNTVPRQLFLVDVATGAQKRLPTTGDIEDNALFSADGRYIVYQTHPAGEKSDDIYALAVNGSAGGPVVQYPGRNELVGWSPGSNWLVFVTNRSGSREIWEVPVKSDLTSGEPEMVRREPLTGDVIGLTHRGTLFYLVNTGQSDVFTAEVDPERKTVVSPPAPVGQRFVGVKSTPAWSADGKSIMYRVARSERPQIVIVGLDGRERDVFPQLTDFYFLLRAHPDGRTVFIMGSAPDRTSGVYRVSLEDGSVQFIATLGDRPAWSANAGTFYHGNGRDTLLARDSTTGQVREVYKHPTAPFAFKNPCTAVSPDGRQLAVMLQGVPPGKNSLAIVPESGGAPEVLLSTGESDAAIAPNTPSWTPDGKYILFMRNSRKSSELWRISLANRVAEPLPLTVHARVFAMRLNPDGRHMIFATNRDDQEMWTLENFLPHAPSR